MTAATTPRVWQGNPALEPFLVPIEDLHEDPANARRHPERNIRDIRASLARFRQQTPIVHDAGGVVRKGNGTLRAAQILGWTHIAALRSDLSGVDLAAYSVADNRTGETSHFDDTDLATLLEAIRSDPEFPLEATGFADAEVDALLARLADEAIAGAGADAGSEAAEEEEEEEDGDAEPEAPTGPRIYPLAILLSRAELRRWQGRKAELDLADDTEAFVRVAGL